MPRAIVLAALGLIGCGRLGFDPAPPGDDAGPPVPVSICKVDRIPVASPPAAADLAIAPTSEGYAAIWVDTTGASPAHGFLLGPTHQVFGSVDLPELKDTRIGGISDAGQKLVLSSATDATETAWILARDLTTISAQATLADHVMGHTPFSSDVSQLRRAFLTGSANTLVTAYVGRDGVIDPATSTFTAAGPVTDLTCTDGPDHGHCVWAEQLTAPAGSSQCTAFDLSLGAPTTPQVGASQVVASDCHDLRNASGPAPEAPQIVVWTTSAGSIEARYLASAGNVLETIAPAGSAPKVQFDGKRFWIAWLDGSGELALSSFELDGTLAHYPLRGWTPDGPEAFELVSRNNETGLVLLSPAGLDFLTTCP